MNTEQILITIFGLGVFITVTFLTLLRYVNEELEKQAAALSKKQKQDAEWVGEWKKHKQSLGVVYPLKDKK